MKRYRIRREFVLDGRGYRPGDIHNFEEWADDVRAARVAELTAVDRIEEVDPPVMPLFNAPVFEDVKDHDEGS